MTDTEWMTCTNLNPMLDFLRSRASNRKLRLFACGCCRRIWHLLVNNSSREAVRIAELFADGHATEIELEDCHQAASQVSNSAQNGAHFAAASTTELSAMDAALYTPNGAEANFLGAELSAAELAQVGLVRDVFGNPFRPLPSLPSEVLNWNDGTVWKIAQAIYDEHAFNRLPILADALEDAGCDNADILAHCRSEGPHVRGCWVIDLLLGKE